MTVWIVQESSYHESEEVLGVYSSLKRANVAAYYFAADAVYPVEEIVVVEAEVDKAIEIPKGYVHNHAVTTVKVLR